jgi:hypothetical protein
MTLLRATLSLSMLHRLSVSIVSARRAGSEAADHALWSMRWLIS